MKGSLWLNHGQPGGVSSEGSKGPLKILRLRLGAFPIVEFSRLYWEGPQDWGQEDALSSYCTRAGGLEINISESSNFFGHLHDPSSARGLEMDGRARYHGGIKGATNKSGDGRRYFQCC